jgi:hypothetical protein
MDNEIVEMDESFNNIALEIVYEEFVSFKATIDGKEPVSQVNTFLEYKLDCIRERLKESFIQFAKDKNKPLSKTFLDELIFVNFFYDYLEYLKLSCLGLLKVRKIEL